MKPPDRLEKMLAELDAALVDRKLAAAGDQIVVVADSRPDLPGETDVLVIHPVGSSEVLMRPASGGSAGNV